MKKIFFYNIIALFSISALIVSCSKNSEDTPISNSRIAKLEISGNYTGNISFTYTNLTGQQVIDTITSLPWVKDMPYSNKVDSIIVSGISDDNGNLGVAGEKAQVKIIVVNEEKISVETIADGSGVLKIPRLSYGFEATKN